MGGSGVSCALSLIYNAMSSRAPATAAYMMMMCTADAFRTSLPQQTPPTSILQTPPAVLPARWRSVHDCDRPKRWRESMDEEECHVMHKTAESPSTTSPRTAHIVFGYADVKPLASMGDFEQACQRASHQDKLVLIKVHSKRC